MFKWLILGVGSIFGVKWALGTSKKTQASQLVQLMRQTIVLDPQTQGQDLAIVVVDNFAAQAQWHPYVEVAYTNDRLVDAQAYFDNLLLKSTQAAFLINIFSGEIIAKRGGA